VTARYLLPKNDPGARKDIEDEYVPAQPNLGGEKSGSWAALPSEDWLELKQAEWRKLLPAEAVQVGGSWDVDRDVAAQLLTRFYPTTENNDLATNRIERQELKATVVSVKKGVVRARLEGSLKMKHTFYPHRDDDRWIDATVLGYIDFTQDKQQILTLRLATDKATYGKPLQHFGVAVRSVSLPMK
jgi:hypothetical protein